MKRLHSPKHKYSLINPNNYFNPEKEMNGVKK